MWLHFFWYVMTQQLAYLEHSLYGQPKAVCFFIRNRCDKYPTGPGLNSDKKKTIFFFFKFNKTNVTFRKKNRSERGGDMFLKPGRICHITLVRT